MQYSKLRCGTIAFVITTFAVLQLIRLVLLSTLIGYGAKNITDSTFTRSRVDYMLKVLSQVLYLGEWIPLLHGICKFRSYTSEETSRNMINDKLHFCIRYIFNVFVFCISPGHLIVSIVPPILLLVFRKDVFTLFYKTSKKEVVTTYVSIALYDHIHNFVVRTVMGFITLIVIIIWKNSIKEVEEYMDETADHPKRVVELAKKYNEAGKLVDAFQNIFQGWFVMKWLIYFIDIVGHSVLATEVIFDTSLQNKDIEKLAFVLSHLIYDFLAFFYMFICGSLMNLHHQKYRAFLYEQQRKCLSDSGNDCLEEMQFCNTLIPENPTYDFLPSAFLINYPLNSPGYTMTMLLALFAFVANFLTPYE